MARQLDRRGTTWCPVEEPELATLDELAARARVGDREGWPCSGRRRNRCWRRSCADTVFAVRKGRWSRPTLPSKATLSLPTWRGPGGARARSSPGCGGCFPLALARYRRSLLRWEGRRCKACPFTS